MSKWSDRRKFKRAIELSNLSDKLNPLKTSQGTSTKLTNNPTTPSYSPPKPDITPRVPSRGGGGSRTFEGYSDTTNTQAMQVLQTAPKVTELEKGSGALRDYQFNIRFNNRLKDLTNERTNFYQKQYETGKLDYETANRNLNRDINNYITTEYESEGYKVTETKEGIQLQREVPVAETIFQKDNFGKTTIKQPTYVEVKPNLIEKINAKLDEKRRPQIEKQYADTGFGIRNWISSKVEESEFYKNRNKEGFLSTGILYKNVDVSYNNPFMKETTKETVKVPIANVNWGKVDVGARNIAKGLFFTPLMATGTQAVLEQGSVGYEYVTINGKRFRRNLLTGKLEAEKPIYEIIGSQEKSISVPSINQGILGRYKVRFGGKEYYVTESGKLIRIGENNQLVTSPKPLDIIKPKITPIQPPITTSTSSVANGLPSMVGGTGLKTLPAPKNYFEVSINVNRLPTEMKGAGALTGGISSLNTNTLGKIEEKPIFKTKQVLTLLPASSLLLTPFVSSASANVFKIKTPSATTQSLVQTQPQLSLNKQLSTSVSLNLQKTRQQQVLKQPQKQIQRSINRFKVPQLIILKKPKEISSKNVFGNFSKKGNIFEAFIKRKGKDISLGKFGDIGSAKGKFLKEVKGTLGASGFITKNKEVVPLKELNLGGEFVPSKKQPLFRAVQRRKFRLSSKGEVTEIMSSKKAKGRKLKWL